MSASRDRDEWDMEDSDDLLPSGKNNTSATRPVVCSIIIPIPVQEFR